jgi:hypothetical protein
MLGVYEKKSGQKEIFGGSGFPSSGRDGSAQAKRRRQKIEHASNNSCAFQSTL